MPLARATGIGSTFDCAAHSKSVCFFDSAIISSPVIGRFSVSVAISSPSFSGGVAGQPRRFWPRKHERTKQDSHDIPFRVFAFSRLRLSLQHRLTLRLELVPRL